MKAKALCPVLAVLFLLPCFALPAFALPAAVIYVAPDGDAAALLQAALYFAATVALNNGFRLGEDLALFTGECIVALIVTVFTVVFFKNKNGGAKV